MGKFAVQCPNCDNYVTAYNGLRGLVQNKITCNKCKTKIDVKAQRMTSVSCPSCKNVVLYDSGKKSPKCPVCKNEILPAIGQKMISFKCPQCGVGLSATEGSTIHHCPICDKAIDVQSEVQKERYSREGFNSLIKYEGDNNTFVWKHPIEDFNTGSILEVHETQEVVFFKDGRALDLLGPGKHVLETENLPLVNGIYNLPSGDTRSIFHSEIYYINTVTQMGIKWGTDSKVRLFDPMSGMHMGIGACGEFNIKVIDSRKVLLKLVGTTNGLVMRPNGLNPDNMQNDSNQNSKSGLSSDIPAVNKYFSSMVMTEVKSYLASVIKDEAISIFEIDAQLKKLSQELRERINVGLEEYGLTMPEFFIRKIITPEDDSNSPDYESFMKYKASFAAVQEEKRKAEVAKAAREAKIIEAETEGELIKIKTKAEAEAHIMQAGAKATEMQMQNYNYQDETRREIGKEAMKNGIISENGGGSSVLEPVIGAGVGLAMAGEVTKTLTGIMHPHNPENFVSNLGNTPSVKWECSNCHLRNLTSEYCPSCGRKREEVWECPKCHMQNLTSKCCPECGTKREEIMQTWECPNCHAKNLISKCCPECGTRREEVIQTWECPNCHMRNLTSKCCPECGAKREEIVQTWECPNCHVKNLTSKCCPECGTKRGE